MRYGPFTATRTNNNNNNNMKYDAGTDPSQPLGLKRRRGTALDADVPGKGQRIRSPPGEATRKAARHGQTAPQGATAAGGALRWHHTA